MPYLAAALGLPRALRGGLLSSTTSQRVTCHSLAACTHCVSGQRAPASKIYLKQRTFPSWLLGTCRCTLGDRRK